VRRLIINADDFGLTAGVNRAIVEAHEKGVVTSATLMATGQAFDQAVALAQSRPRLAVGCHVVLVDGSPVLERARVSHLLSRRGGAANGQSHFRRTMSAFVTHALLDRRISDEIENEAKAQISKLQSAGIKVTHLDSHKHTHVFPQVLRPLLRAARACGVSAMRNPLEPVRWSQLATRPGLLSRWTQVGVLRSLAKQFRGAVREAGMATPDGTFAIVATGSLDERVLRSMLENLPEGTWELVCHPGYNDADLAKIRTRLRNSREQELRILTSESIRDLLKASGIEVISYQELAGIGG
jgi:hopanoid biosynthesis associated protein HpnK